MLTYATVLIKVVAADLLAQAEHDTDALPFLVAVGSNADSIISQVNGHIIGQLADLPTADVAQVAVSKVLKLWYSFVILFVAKILS